MLSFVKEFCQFENIKMLNEKKIVENSNNNNSYNNDDDNDRKNKQVFVFFTSITIERGKNKYG